MRTVYLFLLYLFVAAAAYSQVSLKLLESSTTPSIKAAVKAHKKKDGKTASDLYTKALLEFKNIDAVYPNLSPSEQRIYLTHLFHLCYNSNVFCIQTDSFETHKDQIKISIEQVLTLSKSLVGEKDLLHAYQLSVAAYFYFKTGEFDKVKPLHLEAIQIYKQELGNSHIRYIDEASRLAHFCLETGEPEKANFILLEIEPQLKKHYKKNDFDYFTLLADLFSAHVELNQFKQAAVYLEESLKVLKNLQNQHKDIPNLIKRFSILSEFMENMENLSYTDENSISLLQKSQKRYYKAYEKVYGELNDSYIEELVSQAYIQFTCFDIEKSDFLYKKALQLETRKHGANSPLCKEIREAIKANSSTEGVRERMEKIVAENEKKYGIFSKEVLDLNYALLLTYENDPDKLDIYSEKNNQILTEQIKRKINFLSETDREKWWKHFYVIQFLIKFLNLQLIAENDNFYLSTHVYNSELLLKGFLLNSSQTVKRSILLSGDAALINGWQELEKLKRKDNPTDKEQISQLERFLAIQSQSYREQQSSFDIKCEHIQQVLRPDEASIEFFNVTPPQNSKEESFYCALLLTPNEPYPEIIVLGPVDYVHQAFAKSRKGDQKILYEVVWEPLEEYLQKTKTIYIAPSGILHSVSFGGIKKGDRYLCEDYTIHNLLSTRDIPKIKNQKENSGRSKQITLFGGADFGLPANELAHLDTNLKRGGENNLNRILLDRMDPKRGPGFTYLPGSKKEVLFIGKHLSGSNWKTSQFVDKEATETRFKSLSSVQSPEVIHISTHGFYFPQPQQNVPDRKRVTSAVSPSNVYRLSDNPLMRSGLAFSGANHVWKGLDPVDGMDDGILTAYEISHMNLTHTELVVLSACNTGLGDIDQSEGVYGLQHAFRLAGVQTMIVSLWEVPDKETVELMTGFYLLWGKGLNKKKAFTQAQLRLRQMYPNNPEKWAGFIMIE